MENIYKRIIEQANKKGITGKELGELLGMKKSPLTDWKNKKSKPTVEQIKKMCEIFTVTADWLITGKDKEELTEEEQKLIETFRRCSTEGQAEIQDFAKFTETKRPKTDKLSNSKIG